MSGRVKIKSKVVKSTLQNKDVLDMFHGVIGTDGASLSITHPKYLDIESHVDRFLRILDALYLWPILTLFSEYKDNIDFYNFALRKQVKESFIAPDLEQYLKEDLSIEKDALEKLMASFKDYSKIPPAESDKFSEVYTNIKKCNVVNTIIITCKNLIPYKKSLEDIKNLKDKFLTKSGGINFAPINGLVFNFKHIYIDDRLTVENKEYLLIILHKLYTIGYDLYNILSSPDVDVGEFVTVIMSSIDDVKKHIPRCDQAFNKIAESVDLLKGNFNGYYKDYVSSNNPTIIMENFVMDVSKNTKASPTLTTQFRKIISHYRKMASQQANNPKLKTLFQQVDKNFHELEEQNRKAEAGEYDDSDSESETSTVEENVPEQIIIDPITAAKRSAKNKKYRAKAKAKKDKKAAEKAVEAAESEAAATAAAVEAAESEEAAAVTEDI